MNGVSVLVWGLVFILVIFGSIAGLIVIYQRSKKPSSELQPGDRGYEREAKIFTLYQNLEDMLDGFDAYVEETRTAFDMEKVDLLRQRDEIARMHANVLAMADKMDKQLKEVKGIIEKEAEEREAARRNPPPAPVVTVVKPVAPEPPPVRKAPALMTNNTARERPIMPLRQTPRPAPVQPRVSPAGGRASTIWSMHQKGRSADDIARAMGISKNEVTLTLKLLMEG